MADIVGPSLDQLNAYGTTDQMRQELLDSAFWTTIAVREGASLALSSASISSSGVRLRFGESAPLATVSVSSSGILVRVGSSSSNTFATITSEGIRIQFGASMLAGPASMVANGIRILVASATPQTSAIMEAVANGEFIGESLLSTVVNFTETDVEILGEKWSIVSEDGESWSVAVESDDVWNVVPEGSEDWNEQ